MPLAWSHNPLITLDSSSSATSTLENFMMKRSSPPCQDAAERLHSDPDYRLLHDQVMDLFVERMKSDIGKLKQNKLKLKLNDDVGNDSDDDVFVTEAAAWCVSAYPSEPLTNYYNLGGIVGHKRRDDKKYLEEIAAGNLSGIKYDALLPHQIILYAEDGSDIKQAAELQWKTMVEGMHLKGKFRNYFAVYHTTKYSDKGVGGRMMQGLALLLSQLSEGPWKGKVIVFGNSAKISLCYVRYKAKISRLVEVVFLSALGARFGLISSYWSEFGYPSDGSSGGG
ncbi:hypothetical protein PS1_015809 [Malus domestica]